MGGRSVSASVQQTVMVSRKARDYLRAEGPRGFAYRARRWAGKQRQSYEVTLAHGLPRLTNRYTRWAAEHTPSLAELDRQRAAAATLAYQPTISLMTPVYNPPPEVLRATIESVLAQSYGRWELCLADGASTRPGVHDVLEEYARRDPRVRVAFLDENQGISGNSNAAARLATGEYLMIFDHDDLLAPNALFEIATALDQRPETDLVYVDEDLITYDGRRRFNPNFKPGWSPELLLTANYLMHSVLRRELFWAVGGFDSAYDGAQDWDLAFKVAERTNRIVHVPRVLYHWRTVPGSAASSFAAKPYVFEHQLGAIANHLRRRGVAEAQASFVSPGFVRVAWPTGGERVSVILPDAGDAKALRKTLAMLLRATNYPNFEVLIVPLAETSDAAGGRSSRRAALPDDPRVRLIGHAGALNLAQARNLGAAHASGDLLLFLRPGLEAQHADWLEELARWAMRPESGVVGTKILDARRRVWHAGLVLGLGGPVGSIFQGALDRQGGAFGNADWYRNYLALAGDCQMLRRDLFTHLGGFDERDDTSLADVTLCLRAARLGYRNVYTPYASLQRAREARASSTTGLESSPAYASLQALAQSGDPYFNPNLARDRLMPGI